jgi:hypothetical protein
VMGHEQRYKTTVLVQGGVEVCGGEEGIGMRFGVLPIYGILESRLHQRFSKTQVAIS